MREITHVCHDGNQGEFKMEAGISSKRGPKKTTLYVCENCGEEITITEDKDEG